MVLRSTWAPSPDPLSKAIKDVPVSSRHQAEGIRSKATGEACSGLLNSALPQRFSSPCAVSSCRQQACDGGVVWAQHTRAQRKRGVGGSSSNHWRLSFLVFCIQGCLSHSVLPVSETSPLSLQNPYPSLRSSSWWSHWAKVEDDV